MAIVPVRLMVPRGAASVPPVAAPGRSRAPLLNPWSAPGHDTVPGQLRRRTTLMRTRMLTTAVVATASLAIMCGAAGAQSKSPTTASPTTADFDACNRQAKARIGGDSGSALPRSTAPGSGTTGSMPSVGSQTPNTGSAPSGSGGTSSGSTGSGASGSGMSSSGAKADHTLSGMDATQRGDSAYQAAYQDCMRARGF